ncbi:Homoserine O-acetyltransferase [hydrothermal vent metagenome]|uniref:Homoserine O-acetyltransferase n=1 Tax=hydrothermal vent metagenome TaxID=652676 RepID=A0A3B0S3L6_9ZZZZ
MQSKQKNPQQVVTTKRNKTREYTILLPPSFVLAAGEVLQQSYIKLRQYGDPANPAVIVSGGVSASRAVADSADETGWWRQIVAKNGAIDLNRFCVIGFDFLPNPQETARTISTHDQARALLCALDILKITNIHAFVGASYGGMVALAFASLAPKRISRLCVLSAADRAHPAATALRGVQRRIIAFAQDHDAAGEGVALARQLAMFSYRTPEEFAERFGARPEGMAGAPFDVCKYLIARGDAYEMSAARYLALSDSLDRHNIDASCIHTNSLLIAINSDFLVPLESMRRLYRILPQAKLIELTSLYGHDAFLKEQTSIGPQIKQFIERQIR